MSIECIKSTQKMAELSANNTVKSIDIDGERTHQTFHHRGHLTLEVH